MKLELRGITKVFGSLVANDNIDLVVEAGEIHALLGENGAGKSTLMNVLYGFYDADGGEILVDDKPVTFAGPGEAMAAGIGMVHQHFMLVPVFTVAENVVLGHEPTRTGGILDLAAARRLVSEISDKFGFHIDPDAMVEDLSVGAQQRVEIIKALSRRAEVLILDEPTAVLTPQETDELIAIMRQLKESGTSIVFITHKLREVRAVADRITVIRRGAVVGEASPESTETELASMMVGRTVDLGVNKAAATPGDTTFRVKGLTVLDPAGVRQVDDVSFDVSKGEILVIAGVQGNGQTEITEAIMGLTTPVAGSIELDGVELVGRSVRRVLEAGVGYVPEDRSTDGIIGTFSVAENLVLDMVGTSQFSKGPALNLPAIDANAKHRISEFDIRTQGADQPAGKLSGGNQQKVVMARELSRPLKLFVASQPTRGVDVGSIEFLHQRIVAERDNGTPVIIVSTELDEVLELGDRIAVMYRGRIVGLVPGGTSRDVLGLMMAGVPLEEAERQAAQAHTVLGEADLAAESETPAAPAPTASLTKEGEVTDRSGSPQADATTATPSEQQPSRGTHLLHDLLSSSSLVSVLAVVIALVLGGFLIAAADEDAQAAAGYVFSRPSDFLSASWYAVTDAYQALWQGSVFDWEAETFTRTVRPITETMTVSVPLIFAGLGLGIGFRAGLFNIGAQGQIILGGIFAAFIGFTYQLPVGLHLLLAVIGAAMGGGIWAGIAGVLKARTGANEVIVTIMLNNVAIYLIGYLLTLSAFQRGESNNPISPPLHESALYPQLLGSGFRLHAGFLLALVAAVGVWWLMERSRLGFGFKAVGANPHAARTAGISVENSYIWVMVIAGALAGLGGSAQVLGTEKVLTAGVAASFGFDAITVALLGRSRPFGTVLAGLLFGALRAGGFAMQSRTGTPIDLVLVLQSLIVLLIAAPPLVRAVFRLPKPGTRVRPSSINPTPLTPAKEV